MLKKNSEQNNCSIISGRFRIIDVKGRKNMTLLKCWYVSRQDFSAAGQPFEEVLTGAGTI